VGSDDHGRSLAKEEGRESYGNRDEADDCECMEHTERALSMQRQRSHADKYKRKDVDGSYR
jgi:hypothetical protein